MKTTSTKLMIVTIILALVVYTDSILAALPIPPSLKTVEVPLPSDLDEFIKDRDAPTVINAIFNFSSFRDGRANNILNGENPFSAAMWKCRMPAEPFRSWARKCYI